MAANFMPLLAELGVIYSQVYKHVAPNGAAALQRRLFNKARWVLEALKSSAPESATIGCSIPLLHHE